MDMSVQYGVSGLGLLGIPEMASDGYGPRLGASSGHKSFPLQAAMAAELSHCSIWWHKSLILGHSFMEISSWYGSPPF